MTEWMAHAAYEQRKNYYEPTDCTGTLRIIDDTSPIWTVECDECAFLVGLPAREADPQLAMRRRVNQAGFPSRYAGKTFQWEDVNVETRRTLRQWLKQVGSGLLPAPALHGDPGIGKSHLLVALCTRLAREHGKTVMFRSVSRLLDELQATIDDGGGGLLWHRVTTIPVLALDDLGEERQTDWRADRLARLVDERWERELPILVATNYPPSKWQETFDARTASRLAGMTFPVHLRGPDRRQLALAQHARQEEQ